MMEAPARHLLFHAVVILLVGLIAGFPYGKAIPGNKADPVPHAWRVAHNSLSLGGTMMIAVAAVLSSLQVQPLLKHALAAALIASGYGFTFALTVGPLTGARGLTPNGSLS